MFICHRWYTRCHHKIDPVKWNYVKSHLKLSIHTFCFSIILCLTSRKTHPCSPKTISCVFWQATPTIPLYTLIFSWSSNVHKINGLTRKRLTFPWLTQKVVNKHTEIDLVRVFLVLFLFVLCSVFKSYFISYFTLFYHTKEKGFTQIYHFSCSFFPPPSRTVTGYGYGQPTSSRSKAKITKKDREKEKKKWKINILDFIY